MAGKSAPPQGSVATTRGSARERGYTTQWDKARCGFLREHPLCRMCQDAGLITAATVVDHIVPHKGDKALFWDRDNWQPLCRKCHDTTKKRIEAGHVPQQIGLDGWPVE